ncbi:MULTISPECIES: toll/interleukin-1 receptor domain-containing protein [Bradyrhizobium]|uniref:toll/interleukin-1 receptor domain-containing protein n=1 Tax=Bradyrhizobium TaxID=374 RepID=UPI0009FF2A1D|nr:MULTISPECIES: toll/interleukin-1 receptor domain-containing protein [Bradyrhizobium]UFW51100.1 toll/interleukin-1 receptor domain-containing protein [Bradyrhizobium arachidis]
MEIFLSYPSERLSVAREVYDFLTPLDVRVWFDKASLIPGQDWDLERARAQERADLTILILDQ